MSLIIKGMDMPTAPKTIIIYPNGTIIDGDKKGTKILKAQAIQIERPHGRIIDESKGGVENGWIKLAPTILEAEDTP